MDTKTLKKIEMKNDGHDQERFQALLKRVVNVPKKDVQEREAAEKQSKQNRTKRMV